MNIHPWNPNEGELTLQLIRSRHLPSDRYRISWQRCGHDTEFTGSSRAQRLYVLSGSCEYAVGDANLALTAPCYVDLPAGEFHVCVSSTEDTDIVQVWELPPGFRQPSEEYTIK